MQKEKRNVLIVVIVVVVVLALVGLFFLIHGINVKKNKKESWYNYDTAVVSILVEGSNEGVIEIPLKEITDGNAEIITRIVFTDPGQYESLPPQIEIRKVLSEKPTRISADRTKTVKCVLKLRTDCIDMPTTTVLNFSKRLKSTSTQTKKKIRGIL